MCAGAVGWGASREKPDLQTVVRRSRLWKRPPGSHTNQWRGELGASCLWDISLGDQFMNKLIFYSKSPSWSECGVMRDPDGLICEIQVVSSWFNTYWKPTKAKQNRLNWKHLFESVKQFIISASIFLITLFFKALSVFLSNPRRK